MHLKRSGELIALWRAGPPAGGVGGLYALGSWWPGPATQVQYVCVPVVNMPLTI